jgi:quercetin dioxygenase-like cupin family protein
VVTTVLYRPPSISYPDFQVERIEVPPGVVYELPKRIGASIVLVYKGEGKQQLSLGQERSLQPGSALFIIAEGVLHIKSLDSSSLTLFRASPNL